MSAEIDHQALLKAYSQADYNLRVRNLKTTLLIVFVLVIASVGLDWMVYPEKFYDLIVIDLTWPVLYILLLASLFTPWVKYIKTLSFLTMLIPVLGINGTIFITDSVLSSYGFGLILIFVVGALLLSWTVWEAALICFIVLAAYLSVCLFDYKMTADKVNYPWATFYTNIFILSSAAIACIASCYYQTQRRFTEFKLRYELDIKNQQLAALDELKSQFFANVSHELRTPLTLILAPLDDLLQRGQSFSFEQVQSLLGLMRQNGLRLLRLVNDLLDMVRLEKKQMILHLEPMALSELLSGLIESMQHLANTQGLVLRKELTQDVWVNADKPVLEKIFLNVLHNAIKFTPSGGQIVITVSQDNTQQQAIVEIKDTGIGISDKDLTHVFDRFRQADGSITRQFQGVGLGLSLVKEWVELHQGKISLESQLQQGTCVRMVFPLAESSAIQSKPEISTQLDRIYRAAQVEGALATLPKQFPMPMPPLRSLPTHPLILVVDDEPDMRQYLVSSLQKDYEVLSALSGKEALALIEQYKPMVIILDVMMPELDGLEVCRQLKARADTGDIKIIMLTARVDEDAKLQALRYGADDFLTKPFSSDELKLRVKNQCQAVQATQIIQTHNKDLTEALTKLKQTEAQLFQSEKLSAVGQLAAGLLHELNNPLNAALVMLSIMKEKFRPLQDMVNVEEIDVIEEGLRKIHRVVSEVKVFAYPTAIEDRKPMAFKGLVDSALCFVKQDDYDIEIDLPENITVEVSPMHIIQVLIHLLTNAQKAVVSQNNPKIGVRAQLKENQLEVCVWDNGIGIPPENQQKIFEPFYTTREIGQGLGLGLSVSYSIIKQHGSELTVKSQFQQGTQVIFQLPIFK